jgi:uncharacterized membrane protein YgcG
VGRRRRDAEEEPADDQVDPSPLGAADFWGEASVEMHTAVEGPRPATGGRDHGTERQSEDEPDAADHDRLSRSARLSPVGLGRAAAALIAAGLVSIAAVVLSGAGGTQAASSRPTSSTNGRVVLAGTRSEFQPARQKLPAKASGANSRLHRHRAPARGAAAGSTARGPGSGTAASVAPAAAHNASKASAYAGSGSSGSASSSGGGGGQGSGSSRGGGSRGGCPCGAGGTSDFPLP